MLEFTPVEPLCTPVFGIVLPAVLFCAIAGTATTETAAANNSAFTISSLPTGSVRLAKTNRRQTRLRRVEFFGRYAMWTPAISTSVGSFVGAVG
jgi:hypothetical protein